MRQSTHQFLNHQIKQAVVCLLKRNKINSELPLEYYIDEIMLKTLELCCAYFLKNKSLRNEEKRTLLELQKNIAENVDLAIIENNLIKNLSRIKPVHGELFGTDRGIIYKIFQALKEWPCFTPQARLYYKEQYRQLLLNQFSNQAEKISEHHQQLNTASRLVLDHEKTNDLLSQRAASQFITIQQLKMELISAKKIIEQQAEEIKNIHATTSSHTQLEL